MEPQTLLIGVAGFVLSFLVIYLISVFSMREKTFEEVLEEQRKRQEEEERKAKSERRAEKGERRKYRKFKDKPKSSSPPQSPAASNTKTVVPPVPEFPAKVVVETISSMSAAPTQTGIKAKSPKSAKKAQKSVTSVSNNSGNPGGKNEKPLVAQSSASPRKAKEETVEKNVQQVAAHEKISPNKSNSGKESKTARKTSPPKQTSPVSSSPTQQPQQQQQKQPQQQQQKQPQQQQQKQPLQQQQKQPLQQQQKQQQQEKQQKQPSPQKQPKQEQQKQQKQPPHQEQLKQQQEKQQKPQKQQKSQQQPQLEQQKQQKQKQSQQPPQQEQQKPQRQQKQPQQQQPQQEQQKTQKQQKQPQQQQQQKQPLQQQQQQKQEKQQKQPQQQQQQKPQQEQQKQLEQQKLQKQQKQPQQEQQKQQQEQQKQQQQQQPQKEQQQKQQQQLKQQKQPQQQQQPKNTNSNKGTNNSQTQQNTKSKVEPKSNTKTSKAAKQNANEALEKQILIVEQKLFAASSSEENTTKKLSKKEKKAAAATTATNILVKNVVVATEEKSVKDQAPKEKKAKKGKSENATSGVTQLISSVKGTTLNDSEIQTLLDHLQSKQNKKSQKTDSVAGLRKQLEEKEKKIIEVTECESKAQQAVTELKQKIISAEKQSENKIKKLMNDNKTIQSQAKNTQSQYEQNIATLTKRIKQLESNTVGKEIYQKIVDEVNIFRSAPVTPVIDPAEMASMKQKVQIMEKELNNNVLKLNNSLKNRKKIEDRIKDFETKAKNENKKLEDLNLALKNSNNEKALLTENCNKASEALKATQTECASLKSQLKDKELNNKEAERNLMNLSKKVEELEEELVIVKQKNMILLEENKLVREKPVTMEVNLGERQEPAGAPNGDVQQESLACTKVALVEHERLLGEKQSEIVRLTTELGNKETEIKARLDEKDSEIQALTTSLNVQVGEVEKLKEEIQVFRNKNDELRKRNWKAMEAVENAEKSSVVKINSAVNAMELCQSLDKSVLMRIFPDISVPESSKHDIWVKAFEAEAVKYVKDLQEGLKEISEKCNSLGDELLILAAQIEETESVEDLHKQIETLTTQFKDSTLRYTELQSSSEETKTKLEDRLKELELTFSETKTLCMSLKEQLENASINNSTEEYEKQVETLAVQLEESNEVVKKYQNLLKVTDDKLQVLQRSVEDEEMKWRREQQTLKQSLSEAQKEVEHSRQSQANQTSTQSLAVNSQTEIEKYKLLCLQAEDDEKKVRDLSQTIVKLNGIIKTGQDALSQEQELVRKLKQQLVDRNSTGSPSTTEVEEASTVSSSNNVGTSV